MTFFLADPVTFDPTSFGGGTVLVIIGGLVVAVLRFFVDRPRSKVMEESIETLQKARQIDKQASKEAEERATKERTELKARLEIAETEAKTAKELATQRARVDEMFAWMKGLVETGQPRQEKLMQEIASLSRGVMEAITTGHAVRSETLDRIEKHDEAAIVRHEEQMVVMREMTTVLRKVAIAFDVKINGS